MLDNFDFLRYYKHRVEGTSNWQFYDLMEDTYGGIKDPQEIYIPKPGKHNIQ